MKLRKAIKKIAALGMGATMLGATLLGASAADLNDFPAPFIQNGKFSGLLVVGDNAAAEDVVGVSDIAMSLQFAASVKTGTGSASTTIVEGDAWEVKESGNRLNLYENLTNVKSGSLGPSHLNALADGTFKAKSTQTYFQKLKMPSSAKVVYTASADDWSEDPALYLKFEQGAVVVDYTIDFETAVETDWTASSSKLKDFEDSKISMLGKEYTVTQAVNGSNGIELTLMSGAVQDTLEVGQTKTYTINGKDYEVTVMIVSGDSSTNAVAKFIINDEVTDSLSEDETYTLTDNTDIGVKEVLPTKSGDVVQNLVEFYLGAQKIVFDNANNDMDIGTETSITDVSLNITPTSSQVKMDKIQILWTPTADHIYVPVGSSLSEAAALEDDEYELFLTKLDLDYVFEGLEASAEEVVEFRPVNSDSFGLTFTNADGTTYSKVPIAYQSGTTAVLSGKKASEKIVLREGTHVCKGWYFVTEDYNSKETKV